MRQRNQVRASWAQIDVQLKRRYDLIPNLVETVKGYAAHERDTLDAVVAARSGAMSGRPAPASAIGPPRKTSLTQALGRLFALAEAYPDLKANQNFAALQGELANTEDKIAYARQFYNSAVQTFNTSVQSLPTNVIAGIGGFRARWSSSRRPAASAARSRSVSSGWRGRWTDARCSTSRSAAVGRSAAGSASTAWRGCSPGRPARRRPRPHRTSAPSRRPWSACWSTGGPSPRTPPRSTLLDLAARRFIELRQPGNDPMQTTVHLPATPPDTDRPAAVRAAGPRSGTRRSRSAASCRLTALTFRDERAAKAWNKRLRAEVVADARAAGLSRRRFGPGVTRRAGAAAAVLAAVGVAVAAFHYGLWTRQGRQPRASAPASSPSSFWPRSPADPSASGTPRRAGRGARWLGVRDWLRGHEQFAELPPASVAVWDRYLGYGAALGVTHLASAVLDLGMGNRRLVWSSFGGTWHRVRVRYPRLWPRYGQTDAQLLLWAGVQIVVGVLLLSVFGRARPVPTSGHRRPGAGPRRRTCCPWPPLARSWARRLLARPHPDRPRHGPHASPARCCGGGVAVHRRHRGPPVPAVAHHLAVDDGTDDRTTAWALPSEWADRCQRRRHRHDPGPALEPAGLALDVVGHGRARPPYDSVAEPPTAGPPVGA